MDETPAALTIDVRDVTTTDQLHDVLRSSLGFPAHAGRNWNAVNDVVTGMVDLPRAITFRGWPQLERALPRDSGILRQILERYAAAHADRPGRELHLRYEA